MEEDKAKLIKACHRARILVRSVRDSFIEIQNKIKSDPEAFDKHVLHVSIKELSSSQEDKVWDIHKSVKFSQTFLNRISWILTVMMDNNSWI